MADFKFLVWKIEDLKRICSEEEAEVISNISGKLEELAIKEGRDDDPTYIVVNEDEPYSDEVWKLILNN